MILPRIMGVLLAWAVTEASLMALDAKQVYTAMEPATVVVQSLDSEGSGVIIGSSGLILTNYHVVAANIDLKVRARVRRNGKLEKIETGDVKLLKVHPLYDLALLQVTAPRGATFVAASLLRKGSVVDPGIKCYAIGNPGGPDGTTLETSITEGIVSSASRTFDGKEYIQFSASINPGNSGGPVCDDHGAVIGIATWKMTQAEGLGFAIPASRFSLDEFVNIQDRKPDLELAKAAIDQGVKFNMEANWESGQLRDLLVLMAAECFRIAASADPTSSDPLIRLTKMWMKLGKAEVAQKYIQAARRLDPNNSVCFAILGDLLLKGHEGDQNTIDECIRLWLEGMRVDPNKKRTYSCADYLVPVLVQRKSWAGAAYMARWADVLGKGTGYDSSARARAWWPIEAALPKEQVEGFREKAEGFSVDEFQLVLKGQKIIAAVPKGPEQLALQMPKATSKEDASQLLTSTAKQYASSRVSAPAEGLEIPLPDEPERALLAYGGWKAVVSLPNLAKLCVVNLATAKVESFIDVDDRRTLFATGGNKLVTYSASSNQIKIYDLQSDRLISSRKNALPTPIAFIGMGLLDESRLFALHYEKANTGEQAVVEHLQLPDLTVYRLPISAVNSDGPRKSYPVGAGPLLEGGMDEFGNVAAVRADQNSGTDVFTLTSDGTARYDILSDSMGFPGVSHRGKYIISRGTLVANGDRRDLYSEFGRGPNPYRSSPVAGFPALVDLYLSQGFCGFRIFALPELTKLRATKLPTETLGKLTHAEARLQREVMLASAYCDRIVYVAPEGKKVILFDLGLSDRAEGSSVPRPGAEFTRKLDLGEGSAVTLQSAPAGMRFDEVTRQLTWQIPADQKTGTTLQVIMLIRNADGKEEYKVEKIVIP